MCALFLISDHFFRTLMVKTLILSRKKSVHLEFQLWFLVKFWLSPGKRIKKWLEGGLNHKLLGESQLSNPLDYTVLLINTKHFICIYITVSAQIEQRCSNFHPGFFGAVAFRFGKTAVIIKMLL